MRSKPFLTSSAGRSALTAALLALAAACGAPEPDAAPAATGGPGTAPAATGDTTASTTHDTAAARDTAPAPRDTVVTVYFSRDDAVVPVTRIVRDATLATAIRQLLHGPTAAERATGITSWFSDSTAEMLRSVGIDTGGTAVIDFADLRPVIPNASASAGSAMLLRELNATVFEHAEIRAVQYRIEGSCDIFWEWLQFACRTVQRTEQ
ncbi:MAG TPA: GerMN domain-containing protein [Longimicrobiales bacterium]